MGLYTYTKLTVWARISLHICSQVWNFVVSQLLSQQNNGGITDISNYWHCYINTKGIPLWNSGYNAWSINYEYKKSH